MQVLSKSLINPKGVAKHHCKAPTMSLLVDLDNIMFHKGEARVDVLKLRLKSIHTHVLMHGQDLHWFCNVDTDLALKKNRIVLQGTKHVYSSEVDRADHAIVQHAAIVVSHHDVASMATTVTIVTADLSLMRLAMYIVSKMETSKLKFMRTRLRFASFNDGVILVTRASSLKLITFTSTSDLTKFVVTLNLYGSRYPSTPSASKARVTPILTSARSRISLT